MSKKIILDFGSFSLNAMLFNTPVAESLYDSLPQQIDLTHWGQEMYGSVSGNHGHHQPVSEIPSGGLAYTERGSYFCIFFGQSPAWPVEHVGRITDDDYSGLNRGTINSVTVRKSHD